MDAVSGRLNRSTSIFSTGLMFIGVCFSHHVLGKVVKLQVERQDQVDHDVGQHLLDVALRRRFDNVQQKDDEICPQVIWNEREKMMMSMFASSCSFSMLRGFDTMSCTSSSGRTEPSSMSTVV
uniref:Uncharacterized protein n=1 Tax=Anopheles melas TaxID=34690 RepID=A0A182UEX7_9DIPT